MIPYLQQSFLYEIVNEETLTTIDYTILQFVTYSRTTGIGTMQKLTDKNDDKLDLSDDDLIEEDKVKMAELVDEEKDDASIDLITSPKLKQTTLTQQFDSEKLEKNDKNNAFLTAKSGNESSFGDDSRLSFDPSFPGKKNVSMKKIKRLEKLFCTQDWLQLMDVPDKVEKDVQEHYE
jgi:hypothetical protein